MTDTSGTNGGGGQGGTILGNAKPSIANPVTFIILNGNVGTTGSTANNNSYANANVGYGGGGKTDTNNYGSATGGSGGSGAYMQLIYGPGKLVFGSNISYVLGNAGTGGGTSGANSGIKITWG
jgi:hypothetical protein